MKHTWEQHTHAHTPNPRVTVFTMYSKCCKLNKEVIPENQKKFFNSMESSGAPPWPVYFLLCGKGCLYQVWVTSLITGCSWLQFVYRSCDALLTDSCSLMLTGCKWWHAMYTLNAYFRMVLRNHLKTPEGASVCLLCGAGHWGMGEILYDPGPHLRH